MSRRESGKCSLADVGITSQGTPKPAAIHEKQWAVFVIKRQTRTLYYFQAFGSRAEAIADARRWKAINGKSTTVLQSYRVYVGRTRGF